MGKIKTTAMITMFATALSLFMQTNVVEAYNNICPSNNPYAVKMINSNGNEEDIGCYANQNDALTIMRQQTSTSDRVATVLLGDNVIDTQYGVLQFANVGGTDLIYIYQNATTTGAKTYIAAGGYYGGDAAYVGLENGRYKNVLSGATGYIDSNRANLVPISLAKGVTYYTSNSNGELQHIISKDPTQTGKYDAVTLGPAPNYIQRGEKYYSYDGHYFYRDLRTMLDDYKADTRKNAINPEPYYNYYQFLPYHTLSKLTGQDIDFYISNIKGYTHKPNEHMSLQGNQSILVGEGNSFVESQNYYGANALLTYGIAINESGWGRSNIAITKNNLFGHAAYDNNTNAATTYENVKACIDVHNNSYVSWGYLYSKDYRYYGGHLGNKESGMNVKYASDPYWGEKAAAYYYSVDKSLGANEYQSYMVGIKEQNVSLNIRKEATTSSSVLFALPAHKNVPVVVLGTVKGESINGNDIWYKIQTDSYLDDNRNLLSKYADMWTRPNYKFETNYGYVHSTYIKTYDNSIQEKTGQFYFDSLVFNQDSQKFDFKGYLTITGMNNVASHEIIYELILKNSASNQEFVFQLERDFNGAFDITSSDGYDYSASWFKGSVDLNSLPSGEYTGIVRASSGNKFATALLRNTFLKPQTQSVVTGSNKSIVLRTNYYLKTIPLEIFVRDNGQVADKNNNTFDNMVNAYSELGLVDGNLNIKGFSYNVGISYADENTVSRKLILENTSTFARTSYDLTTLDEGDYEISLRVDDGKSKKRAWFNGTVNISELPVGTYIMYIATASDDFKDYGELNDIFNKPLDVKMEANGKTFEFTNNASHRNRIELKVY